MDLYLKRLIWYDFMFILPISKKRKPCSFGDFFKAPTNSFTDIMKCFSRLFKILMYSSNWRNEMQITYANGEIKRQKCKKS
jgi:hypothetical protein